MSTNVVVEISPDTTTSPVLTSVSQATRPVGSSRMTASRTPSEIWSATLSGWPSVTDSEVNRYSLSESFMVSAIRETGEIRSGKGSGAGQLGGWAAGQVRRDSCPAAVCRAAQLRPSPVLNNQRHPPQLVPLTQPVLDH